MQGFSLNIKGKLYEYTRPLVMGILNITPDSLYASSRAIEAADIRHKVSEMVTQGADIIDVGGYSTRPGHSAVSIDQEMDRLALGISIVKEISTETPVSVDTFRAEVASEAVNSLGADIVNDVSGGELDPDMYATVSKLRVPYVLTHYRHDVKDYSSADDFMAEVLTDMTQKLSKLHQLGVNDVIIDPGFGFGKSLEQNYMLLTDLALLALLKLPLLVGVSRKSMITKLLGITTEDAGNGTTAINTIALQRGASILRVHDVKAARQAVEIYINSLPRR